MCSLLRADHDVLLNLSTLVARSGPINHSGSVLSGMAEMRNLAIAILLACLSGASATIFNSNGTASNVQTLVNGALDGGTVAIPSGNFTWASSVTISAKGVKMQGKDQAALHAGAPAA